MNLPNAGTGVQTIDELVSMVESADQRALAMGRDLREKRITAIDDARTVKITVDSGGQIVGAAVNPGALRTASREQLSDAIVGAARKAQREAHEFAAERVRYYFGD